jgi:hypothetical protein
MSRHKSRFFPDRPTVYEAAERIIEYLGPEESLKNANAAVGAVTPEQKARVLGVIAKAK